MMLMSTPRIISPRSFNIVTTPTGTHLHPHSPQCSGTDGTGLLREHRVMEEGAAAETDAKLKTFDDMTLRIAATAGAQVAYGHGAGESLKSVGPYAFCPPDVALAAAAMGVTYGKASLHNPNATPEPLASNNQAFTNSPPRHTPLTNPCPRLSLAQRPRLLPLHSPVHVRRSHPPPLHIGTRTCVINVWAVDSQRHNDAAATRLVTPSPLTTKPQSSHTTNVTTRPETLSNKSFNP